MYIIIIHICHFSYFAAKVLQQTAKTCQYSEKNAAKMQKSDFFCILILAPEPYCQILLIHAKLVEFSRFLSRIQPNTSRIDILLAHVLSWNVYPSV
jgi:hypothetical protein